MSVQIPGSVIAAAGRRLGNLLLVTWTNFDDWNLTITPALVVAVHKVSGCEITLHGGGEDSPEHALDQKSMSFTQKRGELARIHGAPGALAVLLVKEYRKSQRNNERRKATT